MPIAKEGRKKEEYKKGAFYGFFFGVAALLLLQRAGSYLFPGASPSSPPAADTRDRRDATEGGTSTGFSESFGKRGSSSGVSAPEEENPSAAEATATVSDAGKRVFRTPVRRQVDDAKIEPLAKPPLVRKGAAPQKRAEEKTVTSPSSPLFNFFQPSHFSPDKGSTAEPAAAVPKERVTDRDPDTRFPDPEPSKRLHERPHRSPAHAPRRGRAEIEREKQTAKAAPRELPDDSGARAMAKARKAQCAASFGKKSYLPEAKKRLPPMLYTYPGSGNTWGRLLIEYATGIFTGSVYNDKTLLDALPGEFTCNWQVSVVKVHPHTHAFHELRDGTFNSDNGKCNKGNVGAFKRAVLLIRNPFDSIWSEYQRRVTQSHVDGIRKVGFDWPRWQANAASMSTSYKNMWRYHYLGIEEAYKPQDVLYVRYEDLKDKAKRVAALRTISEFLHIDASDERLECAFVLAESEKAHRNVDPSVAMTKDVAFTKELACRMWRAFGQFASKHNYTSWNGFDCEGYPEIHNVNVGPQGEYNFKWVKPGQKLLDFGGHDSLPPADLRADSEASSSRTKSAARKERKREQRLRKGAPAGAAEEGGRGAMSIEQAGQLAGVANLGSAKPVWQE